MNCLEFRRQLLEDPFRTEQALLAHEAECPQCETFARDLRAQETRLRALLNEPSPPPELGANIELAIQLDRTTRSRRNTWFAAAASLTLVIGATLVSLVSETWERGNMALAQTVLHHIDDEAHHLREAGPISDQRVKYVFARFGAELNQEIGQVNFAAECLMKTRNGVHLVLPGEHGPITVFYMPGETVSEEVEIDSARFDGVIVPTEWGSVAVVGENGEALQPLTQKLASAVSWPHQGTNNLVSFQATAAPLIAQQ